jgi:membrane protease YdiL (CAAX protease family)
MEKLSRRDWTFLAICVAVFAISLAVVLTNFSRAFPEASIEFRYDRSASRTLAERVLRGERIDPSSLRHTAVFDADDAAKIFLERNLGLEKASVVMRQDVHLWFWRHRWFRSMQEEEYAVDVAPTGQIVAFSHRIPEKHAIPTPDAAAARAIAESFLVRNGIALTSIHLISQSERNLPHRLQRIFTWESNSIRPGGAPYRYEVSIDGDVIGAFTQHLRVPDEWQRTYRELRSKNLLAGKVDTVFLVITMIAALAVFIVRLRRGDMRLRFLLGVGVVAIVLTAGVSVNSFPGALAEYDTTTSYSAFLAQFSVGTVLQALGAAMLLIVICGAGEVLYRESQPQHLAISRLWTPRALGSKRVFRSFVLAYALVAFFLAYQVVFYLVAGHFGAWAPADIPYDDILNSALPWVAVLFAGFFPALSEEFLSRAFSIPFFTRVLRSRIVAIIVAGFIWGFGHSTYPNQPFFIRGLEVGVAGVLLGFLFEAFGLLPLLIWHYTVDAFYTAMLLFRSHNAYYIGSAAVASFIFAVPMLLSIAMYLRRGGFVSDDDLTNATMPVTAPPPPVAAGAAVELPAGTPLTQRALIVCAVAILAAGVVAAMRPASPDDAVDYRITRTKAKELATAHMQRLQASSQAAGAAAGAPPYSRTIATTAEGFRSWAADSPREDGGGPGSFDSTAAEYMLHRGLSIQKLVAVFRSKIEAGTWTVRFFTPMKTGEFFVEVDPRTSRTIGYHKYQAEKNAGARLDQAQALAIAVPAFRLYGLDPASFALKEALSFPQPNRRDWLFHFQEAQPIVADAFRRATIRVAGSEVTQFNVTVKIPDEVYRDASKQTLRNVILMVLKFGGGMVAVTTLVTGFVIAAMRRRPRWDRALRWTLVLAVIPILSAAAGYEDALFGYNTSVRWDTFFASFSVDLLRSIGLRLGVIFLAFAVIDAAFPSAFAVLSREGRTRFGRSAVVAAFTALAAAVSIRGCVQLVADRFPGSAMISLDIPNLVAIAFPAALAIGNAIFNAVIGSAIAACFAVAFSTMSKRRWLPGAMIVAIVFCAALDPGVASAGMPLMLLRSALLSVAAWAVVRYVLTGSMLAWPVTIFTAAMLDAAATMATNDRSDLLVNSIVVMMVLAGAILWLVVPHTVERHA